MYDIRDFTKQKNFPGTTGNSFDVILHRYANLEKIPAFLFGLILFGLSVLVTWANWPRAFILFAFFLTDWLLLALLPNAGVSFGPAKPPTTLLAAARSLFTWLPLPVFLAFEILGTLLVIYGFWIEPQRLTVTHQQLRSDKLLPGKKIRILHLGDLHVERITKRERQLTTEIKRLKPDLILFSGDVLNLSYLRDPQAWQAAREVMSHWQAPYGTYGVSGSPAVDLEDVLPGLLDGTVRLLKNECLPITVEGQRLNLVGVHCSHKPFLDAPILEDLIEKEPEHFSILLYHSPDLAPNAAQHGLDLHLAGHTHGGQVRLPFLGALFTASLYGKRFEAGRYVIGKLVLYITRGIGLEGAGAPRVRLLCPPEIILWEITSSRNE